MDALFKRAVEAGAKSSREPEDMFWDDRYGTLEDPFGHSWSIATHIEEVTPEEMDERAKRFFSQL